MYLAACNLTVLNPVLYYILHPTILELESRYFTVSFIECPPLNLNGKLSQRQGSTLVAGPIQYVTAKTNMRTFTIMACFLLLSPIRRTLCASANQLETALHPRGSPSRTTSPSRPRGKGPAHDTHSTRLFGVNIHPNHANPPPHQAHSTRLFGVNVTPGKPTSPSHTTESSPHSSPEHPKLPNMRHVVAGLYVHPSKLKRPGPNTPTDASKKPKSTVKTEEREPWWKKEGGRPTVRRPLGTGPRYEQQRNAREKKKQLLQEQQAGLHSSGHPQYFHKGGGGRGPGSPGAGTHAVSKRRLATVEY